MADTEMNVPDGWKQVDLGSIISIISDGGTPSRAVSRYFGGDIPWIVIDDIKDDIYETTECLTEMGLSACSSNYWDEGTVILSTGATIGVVGITRVKAATKQGICGIEFKNSIDNKYMMYLLKSMRKTFLAYSQGSTIREIRPTLIKKLEVQIPQSLTEQRQIARILSKVDEAISQTEQLIAKYCRLKTGLMQDLLTKGIDEHGNIRSEETHAFKVKDSPLGRIPVEWIQCTLGDAITLQRGFDITSKTSVSGVIPIISSSGLTGYHNQAMVKGPGVITGRKGTLGKVFFLEKDFWPHDTTLWVKDFKGNHSFFVSLILEKLELKRFDVATANPTLNRNFIHPLPIIIPSNLSEQERIAKNIILANKPIEQTKKDLAKLQSLKTGLMQDLLSGKVRVGQLIPEIVEAC